MMPASLSLALAYLKPKRHLLSAINMLAITGTLIGVAVLIIVTSVMNGFDAIWKEKLLSFQPHVTVFSYRDLIDETHPLFEELRELEGVTHVSPFLQSSVIIQNGEVMDLPMLRGVDPEQDELFRQMTANPKETLRDGSYDLQEEECLIGIDLANRLGVRAGDTISVISPATFAQEDEILLPEDLRVAGIFDLGMWQIDSGVVVTDLYTARDVLGLDRGIHGMMVLGEDIMEADDLAKRISEIAGYRFTALSWIRMNQQLFGALRMEKSMMFFLLAIISIVASFLVTCTLIMVSVQKTREIGLLKSMGFRNGTLMGIFMWYGLIQGVFGIFLGTGAGFLILRFRQNILNGLSAVTGFDPLPKELYYLDELPALTRMDDVLLIIGLVLLLCVLGGVFPAWLAARKDPVESLRHD